jgi:GDPmannose 4,6-dehydratase
LRANCRSRILFPVKRAFITGIAGQDGSYLAELLLENDYEVHGFIRPGPIPPIRLQQLTSDSKLFNHRFFLHPGDLLDHSALQTALSKSAPDEIYHLAAQSHVGQSFDAVENACQTTALGTLRLLNLLRALPQSPRFFHASSSEVFGKATQSSQDETIPFIPATPYGCAKAFATNLVRVYRQTFGLFAINGILFNHESPRRGEHFVSKKICRAAAAIKLGLQTDLVLGDTSARRDWGHARDYVRGMWLAMQHSTAEDFVFATGQLHSVQDMVELAFETVGLDWRQHVRSDSKLFRPAEPHHLLGNAVKAKKLLGWEPECNFKQLIREMAQAELDALSKNA